MYITDALQFKHLSSGLPRQTHTQLVERVNSVLTGGWNIIYHDNIAHLAVTWKPIYAVGTSKMEVESKSQTLLNYLELFIKHIWNTWWISARQPLGKDTRDELYLTPWCLCPFLVAQVRIASQPKASLPYLVKRHRGRCQVRISTDVSFGLNFWYSWPTLTLQDALNAKPEKSYTQGPLQVCTKHASR